MDLIQSVGSEHLLQAVEAQADKLGLVQDILLEVNIGMEESKGGWTRPSSVPWLSWLSPCPMCACGV